MRWVRLQGGCSCEVGVVVRWCLEKYINGLGSNVKILYKNLYNRAFNDAHFILTLKFKVNIYYLELVNIRIKIIA